MKKFIIAALLLSLISFASCSADTEKDITVTEKITSSESKTKKNESAEDAEPSANPSNKNADRSDKNKSIPENKTTGSSVEPAESFSFELEENELPPIRF